MQPVSSPEGLSRKREDLLDRAAMTASLLCLVHCLALPLLIAAIPVLSSALAVPESFHLSMLLFAVPTSCLALYAGRARHRINWPLASGLTGLTLLAAGVLVSGASKAETLLTVAGGLMLAAAHIGNWRLRHAGHAHVATALSSHATAASRG